MNKIKIEIVRDFDGTYYANVTNNDELIKDLPEYVNYSTLKKAIKGKINFELPLLKTLKFEKLHRKAYAYFGDW